MQKRIISRIPAMTAGLVAAAFVLDPGGLLAAGDCIEQPNRTAAQGGHWYYHLDRTSGRKCWHLSESEPPARPPQADTPPAPPAPDVDQRPPFSSFFSSLTGGFTTSSVGASQPDAAGRDARGTPTAQPEGPRSDEAVPPRRRLRADAKPAPDRQASSRPGKETANRPHPVSLDQAERDALFRDFLRWRERQ